MSLYAPKKEKRRIKLLKNRPLLWGCIIAAAVLFLVCILWVTGVFSAAHNTVAAWFTPNTAVNAPEENASMPQKTPPPVEKNIPASLKGAFLRVGTDFSATDTGSAKASAATALTTLHNQGLNTVFVPLFYNGQALTSSTVLPPLYTEDVFAYIIENAHTAGLTVLPVVDLSWTQGTNALLDPIKTEELYAFLAELVQNYAIDGLLLDGYAVAAEQISCENENPVLQAAIAGMGQPLYRQTVLTARMKKLSEKIAEYAPTLYTGLICDPIWATETQQTGGIGITAEASALTDGCADTRSWLQTGLFDLAVVKCDTSTEVKQRPFKTLTDWWSDTLSGQADLVFVLYNSKIASGENGWKSPDQIVKQLMVLENYDPLMGFVFDDFTKLHTDNTGSTSAIYKYLHGDISKDYVLKALSVTSPTKTSFTTYSSTLSLIGASDPAFPMTLNGKSIKRTELGYFSLDMDLKLGTNTFVLEHKGETKKYTVTYKKRVIESISPTSSLTLDGGSTLIVSAVALANSTVTAMLNGQTITLQEEAVFDNVGTRSEYSHYRGTFTMPTFTDGNKNIGKVAFTVRSSYGTESRSGGAVTIRKTEIIDTEILPSGGKYIDPDGNYIAEVVKYQAETFDGGKANDDWSRPTNNYLPLGTIDYCSADSIVDPESKNVYRLLRSNQRVYVTSKGIANVSVYKGILPEVNNIALSALTETAQHTQLAFTVDWKAPFTFDLLPQDYPYSKNGSVQNYTVNKTTYQYIDITFKYAATAEGEINLGENHPLFSKAEWIKNGKDYILRLTLKKTGAFYGWSAEYNEKDELVFSFLKPAKITQAENDYGVSLEGIEILIDAGHGGADVGALGSNKKYTEAKLNLDLAKMLKAELEALGATVYMTRTEDVNPSSDDRMKMIKNLTPDFAISIHRNSNEKTSPKGFGSFYFYPYSAGASDFIYNATQEADLYKNSTYRKNEFHYFFLSRVTDCPVVLTENGFMTNSEEFSNMIQESFNQDCAKALTQGIVNYFKSIQ